MQNESFKEAFLHFIWQFQYFEKKRLTAVSGTEVQVLSTGFLNTNAGPDFQNARILLDDVEWYGQIEIHYRSSDWLKHKHHTDAGYNNVILHVVWKHDTDVTRQDGTSIPTLELKDRIDPTLIARFEQFIKTEHSVPCSTYFTENKIETITLSSMLEKCLVERLREKAEQILLIHEQTRQNWEETAYRWLGKCYGFKVNSYPFLKLCETVPFSIVKKYRNNHLQTEALLFGVAGFLEDSFTTDYPSGLQKEYKYLASKHQLDRQINLAEWKFLRLRPANFPTIRISQFAGLLSQTENLFDLVFTSQGLDDFAKLVVQDASLYWHDHFVFDKPSSTTKAHTSLGKSSKDNLIINALLPLRFAFAHFMGLDDIKMNVVEAFRSVKAEKNSLLSQFDFLNLPSTTSFETQALTQLHHAYCEARKCLSCQIGHELIHP